MAKGHDLFDRWGIEVQWIGGTPYFAVSHQLCGGISYGDFDDLGKAVGAALLHRSSEVIHTQEDESSGRQ
jgi:hypothetical protein